MIKILIHCSIHGTPYSVYYDEPHLRDHDSAKRRAEEFREAHAMFCPGNITLETKVENART